MNTKIYNFFFIIINFFHFIYIYVFVPLFSEINNIFFIFINILFSNKTNFIFSELYNFYYLNNNTHINKLEINNNINYTSNYFSNVDNNFINKYSNEEISNTSRFLRFYNPIFKYDYKSGDYFPKLYEQVYSSLFATINDLTSSIRTAP